MNIDKKLGNKKNRDDPNEESVENKIINLALPIYSQDISYQIVD